MSNIKYISNLKWVIIAGLVFIMTSCNQHPLLDQQNGFRDFKFGMAFDSTKGFIPKDSLGSTAYYTLKNDKLMIGSADINQIVYGFYNGKLYNVRIAAQPYDGEKVLSVLIEKYGKPDQDLPLLGRGEGTYKWSGSIASIFYNEHSALDTSHTVIEIYNNKLSDSVIAQFSKDFEKEEKANIKKGKGDI